MLEQFLYSLELNKEKLLLFNKTYEPGNFKRKSLDLQDMMFEGDIIR